MNKEQLKTFNLVHDTQFEVNKRQYTAIKTQMDGVCATREENGRYFAKCMVHTSHYRKEIMDLLNKNS